MSQEIPIPLVGDAYANVDEVALKEGYGPELWDGYVDEMGSLNKRAGLVSYLDLDTDKPIDGLYWWKEKQYLLAVSNGVVYKITGNDVPVKTQVSVPSSCFIKAGTRVSFCTNGETVFMASGDTGTSHDLFSYQDGGNVTALTDEDIPTGITHLAYLDGYIIANMGDTGEWRFSEVDDPTNWSSLNFYTAEGAPDDISSLFVNQRLLYLVGNDSIELWYNDGVSPFSRHGEAIVSFGSDCPYASCIADNALFFFASNRRMIRLDALTPQLVSSPFDRIFDKINTVRDAMLDRAVFDGREFLVLTFPTESKTFVYDLMQKKWSRWSYYNKDSGDRSRYRGNCYSYAEGWNKHIVGDYELGILYTSSADAYDDNTNPISTMRRTAFLSHGTLKQKRARKMSFVVKSGVGNSNFNVPLYSAFNSTTDYVETDVSVRDSVGESGGYAVYSLEFWHYSNTSFGVAVGVTNDLLSGGDRKSFSFGSFDYGTSWYYKLGISGTPISTGIPITLGQWTHIVWTADGSYIKLYVNGVLKDTDIGGHPKESMPKNGEVAGGGSHTGPMGIGALRHADEVGYTPPANLFWQGYIEEVHLYNICLDSTQVLARYNNGSGVYGLLPETGLVAGFHFDERTGLLTRNYYTGTNCSILGSGGSVWVEGHVFPVPAFEGNMITTESPNMILEWRDQFGIWECERTIPLGAIGDRDQTPFITNLGMYRQRQYQITHTDRSSFVLTGASAEIESMTK